MLTQLRTGGGQGFRWSYAALLAYRRGVDYLVRTQYPDGSWYVRSRSMKFQPYFESGFPFGHDQWISAAATSWASMALSAAAKSSTNTVANRSLRMPNELSANGSGCAGGLNCVLHLWLPGARHTQRQGIHAVSRRRVPAGECGPEPYACWIARHLHGDPVNFGTIQISGKLALELVASALIEWTLVGVVVEVVYKPGVVEEGKAQPRPRVQSVTCSRTAKSPGFHACAMI